MAITKTIPIGLTDRVGLLAGVDVQVDAGRMSAPALEALLIDEMRFVINYPVSGTLPSGGMNGGGAILAKIELGAMPLTDDFVPLWNFDESGPIWQQFIAGEGAGRNALESINGSTSFHRFRFPKPLLVLPGVSFNIKIRRRLSPDPWSALVAADDPVNVDIAALGHVVTGQRPSYINVPFVSAFVGTYTAAASNTARLLVSSEAQLKNKIGRTIHIEKIVGRMGLFQRGPPVNGEGDTGSPSRLVTVKITSSDFGIDPVTRPTPFVNIFPAYRHILPLPRDLSPQERLTAEVFLPSGSIQPGDYAPFISFVAWREEAI